MDSLLGFFVVNADITVMIRVRLTAAKEWRQRHRGEDRFGVWLLRWEITWRNEMRAIGLDSDHHYFGPALYNFQLLVTFFLTAHKYH